MFSNTNTGSKPADPYKEKNADTDVSLKEKIEDLSSFVSDCKFGMMTTRSTTGQLVSRCMALAGKESGGIDLIVHTNTETGKTDDLESDPHTNVCFLNSSGEWASISGTTAVITDRDVVKKYYSTSLKAWVGDLGDGTHDGGPQDPRIALITVSPKQIQYTISSKNMVTMAVELAKGIITGEAAQVNKLRHISAEEVQQWRSS